MSDFAFRILKKVELPPMPAEELEEIIDGLTRWWSGEETTPRVEAILDLFCEQARREWEREWEEEGLL